MGDGVEEHLDEHSLELSGSVDARTSREVRSALQALIEVPGRVVVVDLRRVTSADVIGLRVIAAASRNASLRGSRVVLRAAPPAVRRLLTISRLARVVEFEEQRRVS
jgi:anti-anti-sigma factor